MAQVPVNERKQPPSTTITSTPYRGTGYVARVRVGEALPITAVVFNIGLCLISTRGWVIVGAGLITNISLVIVTLGALEAAHAVRSKNVYILSLSIVAVLIELKMLNQDLDLKIVFDLSIPVIFFFLGRGASPVQAKAAISIIVIFVIVFALAEWLTPDLFQSTFNVWEYYVNKGVINSETINYSDTTFTINGVRSVDVGRTTFSWLFGVHRVSSVFLEPVSMGNFAIISLIWTLCMERGARRWYLLFSSAAFVVLPDSRYALGTAVLIVLVVVLEFDRYRVLWSLLPLAVLLVLVFWGVCTLGVNEVPAVLSDDLKGRLEFSGKLLASWTPWNWFALAASNIYTLDTGYAYLLNNAGLPIAVLLLFMLSRIKPSNNIEQRFKALLMIYLSTSLCIGASFFSIKTASLLWYLYGHVSVPKNTNILLKGVTRSHYLPI